MRSRPPRKPETGDSRGFDLGAESSAADDVERACHRTAVDLLARREHSRLELERKLAKRAYPSATVTAVLDALEAAGLVSADRFTESFMRARVAKGQGPVRIALELAQRGVDGGESHVRQADYDWTELARAARVKRFGPEPPGDFKARARQARFLEYRGFTGEQIAAALEIGTESD